MTPDRLGPYRIVSKLGRGGMGTVFLGVDDAANQSAAVKLLSAEMAQQADFRDRFKAEIEILRKLHHPNIVQIFGYGEQESHIFYAMEYVSGSSLETQLARGRAFQWREVAQFGIEIARALRHAHDRGIIHRDIKPGNLLLTEEGSLKLSDFGIARLFWKSRVTGVGSVLGTAEFMAAEQAEGRAVDQRSDLYSLGAVLYVLLARRPLYSARSFFEMLEKQRVEKPAPLHTLVSDVPAEFEQIIHRLLEKDPERRFATATVLQRRLEAMLESLNLPLEQPIDPGIDHVTVQPAAVNMPPGVDPPPIDPLAVTVDATHRAELPARGFPSELPSPLTAIPKHSLNPPLAAVSAADTPRLLEAAQGEVAASLVETPLERPDETATSSATAAGRFVAVRPGELDDEPDEPRQPPWISPQTWALVIGLLAIWLLAWYMLQPPSANTLYHRIQRQTADGAADTSSQAEDDIHQFLERYPDDERRAEVSDALERLELSRLERRLSLHGPKSPVERCYIDALNTARTDLDLGIARFQALVDLFESPEATFAPDWQCVQLAKRQIEALRKQAEAQHREQLVAVRTRLSHADEMAASDPQRAAAIRRAVIFLYQGKPWAKDLVEHARAALEKP
jgi:eukaryotic-like serine/threonine-protein kinase